MLRSDHRSQLFRGCNGFCSPVGLSLAVLGAALIPGVFIGIDFLPPPGIDSGRHSCTDAGPRCRRPRDGDQAAADVGTVSYVPVAKSTRTTLAIGSGRTSRPSRTSRMRRCFASSCSDRDTFGCARPVIATSAAMFAGRSRSRTPSRSSASRDRAASSGAAGSGEGCRSPRATPRISSRSSVREVRVIVVLHLQLFKFERRIFLPAGLLDGGE